MDPLRGSGSPRGPPNGALGMQRPTMGASREHLMPAASSNQPSRAMTRAEKFEDEKKRITLTCFSKLDDDGKLQESYITHIRVEEDALHPSSPPPPDSPPQYKKPRVIIAAVKNTGRVFLHKARENDDGSFQIGKSWPIDEIQEIESFSDPEIGDPQRAQRAQWAGKVGFAITMAKPYFWAAKTQKEKDFFVSSLVKIYRKYTQGKVPKLVGFSRFERDELLAASAPPSQATTRTATPAGARADPPPPLPTNLNLRPGSRDAPSGPLTPSSFNSHQQPLAQESVTSLRSQTGGTGTPNLSSRPSHDSNLRSNHALEAPRPPFAASASSSRNLSPQASLPSLQGHRKDSVSSQDHPGSLRHETDSIRSRIGQYGAGPSASSDSLPLNSTRNFPTRANGNAETPGSYDARKEPNFSNARPQPTLEAPFEQKIPERRRPPLHESEYRSPRKTDDPSDPDMVKPLVPKPPQQQIPSRPSTGTRDRDASTPDQTSAYASPKLASTPRETSSGTQDDVFSRTSGSADTPKSNTSADGEQSEDQQFRPGLGPMMGKKMDAANKLRKAATAYSAFKPRAGGAGDRLFSAKSKQGEEPDGVTRVVPAPMPKPESPKKPSLDRTSSGPTSPLRQSQDRPQTPITIPPAQTVQSPKTPEVNREASHDEPQPQVDGAVDKLTALKKAPGHKIKRQRSNKYAKAFMALDIDSLVLEGRQTEYENILSDFGWSDTILQHRKLEAIESDIRREIGRLEAGSWLGHSDQKDDRVEMVEAYLDKAIKECDEMEGLLTLYGVELGTLNDDVTYIEAQSQGLQVQTANQKLLHSELETLIDTLSISEAQLDPLERAPFDDRAGLDAIENTLLLLSKALRTIDPSFFSSTSSSGDDFGDGELNRMRALQEKKHTYEQYAYKFMQRFIKYVYVAIQQALEKTRHAIPRQQPSKAVDHSAVHDIARNELWRLSGLMLFVKELDTIRWDEIMRAYQALTQPIYQDEIRSSLELWRRATRKATGDEQEAIFTSVLHKESEGITTSARKLTIKRSQTLAKGLRSAVYEKKKSALAPSQEAKYESSEIFDMALDEIVPLVCQEQNFITDFFHAKTVGNIDFVDLVSSTTHSQRKMPDIRAEKHIEPDRLMSEKVLEVMGGLFSTWTVELRNLVDWAVKENPLQGIGILYSLEVHRSRLEDTNQDFVIRTLQKLHEHLAALVTRFVDDQIRAIEEAKIKRRKKNGVISFVRVFPLFAAVIENMVPPDSARDAPEIRALVDSCYDRLNKAIFDGIRTMAKDSSVNAPGAYNIGVSSGHTADPEDKERLHYHIMYIQNLFHYKFQLGDDHKDNRNGRGEENVLGKWKLRAEEECKEHQDQYVSAIIRRPMGKLLDFLESMEMRMNALHPGEPPSSLALTNPSQNKDAFRKALKGTDPKTLKTEISRNIKQRIHRHFEEGDEENTLQKLERALLDECEQRYLQILERATMLSTRVYDGEVRPEFSKSDISNVFQGR